MAHGTPRTRRVGIRALFALTVLLPLAGAGAAVLWVGGRTVERAVQERLEEDVQLVARAIQLPLSSALAEGRQAQLYDALESAFRIRRLYGASVYDASGQLVAQVGAEAFASEAPAVGRVAEAGRGGEYGRLGGRRVYSYFVPLTTPGGRIGGLLQVTRRRSDIEATVRRVRLQSAAAFGAVWLLVAGVVLLTYHRGIGRHFGDLAAAMANVERGERGNRVAERGPREVAEIAAAFNRMVAGVERAEAQVMEQRRRELALEDRLRRTQKLAAIGRLAAGVAHELGTPLAVADGAAQRLERRGEVRAETGAIRGAVRRMSDIVRRLLEFGTRASGERQVVSGSSLLVSAAGAARSEAGERGVELEVEAASSDLPVRGDPHRLESALVHLLRNAVQAAGKGGLVRASVAATSDGVIFRVEDSGGGVPDDVRDRLFEPFFTTKPVGEGSGLGLAVVHAVAEEHGGWVDVGRSVLGGARFGLIIPRGEHD